MKKFLLSASLLVLLGAGCSAATQQTASNPQPAANTAGKTYALVDVAKHNSATDCWMAISGKVYDVTSYVDNHPGGPAILKGCGQDATTIFNSVPKHSGKADSILPTYYIGDLK